MILKKYGEERLARHIAHAIVESRYTFGKITRTKQLADIVSTAFDGYVNTTCESMYPVSLIIFFLYAGEKTMSNRPNRIY